jgi:site-specific recombinase XerD
MGKLKEQMLELMTIRNYSKRTIQAYVYHVTAYTKLFGKSPEDMGSEEMRKYLFYLKDEKRTSWSNINVAYNALKYFSEKVLDRDFELAKIPRPRGQWKLPEVLSELEVKMILGVVENIKHQVMLMGAYSAGLRLSEVTHLKVGDIDSERNLIRVSQGKGQKDRYTILSQVYLSKLRTYWDIHRPTTWLFPGNNKSNRISESTIQKVFIAAKKKLV